MIARITVGHRHLYVTGFEQKSIVFIAKTPYTQHATCATTSKEVHIVIAGYAQMRQFVALALGLEGKVHRFLGISRCCEKLSAATIGGSALLHRHIVSESGAQDALVFGADKLEFLSLYGQCHLRFQQIAIAFIGEKHITLGKLYAKINRFFGSRKLRSELC